MGDDGDLFVFEIKTRATAPQRYDVKNIKDYLDYEITQREGLHSSYEREFFDLVRSLLIKYFFQIKMGRMDGAFIAYHNTEEIFAFEYITLKEIEKRLLGSEFFGDLVLKMCANLL